jgi:hypothetical protein
VDKDLMRKLLDHTDLQHQEVRDLDLFVPPAGETVEVLVFDNELAIYRTTVDDVALRKSPELREMFSISNIKKILNDQDVIVSKGKDSIHHVHARALAQLDLTCTREDLEILLEDARLALEEKSPEQIQESFDLFFELLGFQLLSLEGVGDNLHLFARAKTNGGSGFDFEHLIIYDEDNRLVSLKKGNFSPQNDLDLAWVIQFAQNEAEADLHAMEVFKFLAELVRKKG